jgi:hypothetical protein
MLRKYREKESQEWPLYRVAGHIGCNGSFIAYDGFIHRELKAVFLIQLNVPYFIEGFRRADFQLLSTPPLFLKIFFDPRWISFSFNISCFSQYILSSFSSCKECGFFTYGVSFSTSAIINNRNYPDLNTW